MSKKVLLILLMAASATVALKAGEEVGFPVQELSLFSQNQTYSLLLGTSCEKFNKYMDSHLDTADFVSVADELISDSASTIALWRSLQDNNAKSESVFDAAVRQKLEKDLSSYIKLTQAGVDLCRYLCEYKGAKEMRVLHEKLTDLESLNLAQEPKTEKEAEILRHQQAYADYIRSVYLAQYQEACAQLENDARRHIAMEQKLRMLRELATQFGIEVPNS